MAGRIQRLSSHLMIAAQTVGRSDRNDNLMQMSSPHRHGFAGPDPSQMEQYRAALPVVPRVDKALGTWSTSDLLRRCQGLGATDAQLDAIIETDDSRNALLALVQQLEPPSPQNVTVEDITVDARSTSIEAMAKMLEEFGAVVVTNAASAALMDAVDSQLDAAGAWAISRGEQAAGRPASRMHMELLVKAPLAGDLVTNEFALGVSRQLLTPHCKRIALKELCAFEVQPGNVKQHFHREDQFWPWHHEPDTWAVNMLWAIDDFTAENGGTHMIPYSHRSTMYMRENGRELLEGNYDPNDVLKLRMPRGSVLLFAGGLIHGSGPNSSLEGRKCLLSAFQLGWLRPEYKFWAHKELHEALSEGKLSAELTDLMGHVRLSLASARSHVVNSSGDYQFEYGDPSVQPGDAGRVENTGEYQSMVQEEPYLGVGMQHMDNIGTRPRLKKGQGFAVLFPY